MSYPKSMYKGSYTKDAINAEDHTVNNEKEEKALRNKGFVDGNEFFKQKPEPVEPPVPVKPPTPPVQLPVPPTPPVVPPKPPAPLPPKSAEPLKTT